MAERIRLAIILTIAVFPAQAVDFKKDIQPLLKNKCSRCHSGHEAKGEFSINTRPTLLKTAQLAPTNRSVQRLLFLINSNLK